MQPNEEAAPVSQDPMHKGHPVDVTFENYSAEHVNRYTAHMNAIREQCPVAWSDGHWSPKDTGFWLLTSYAKVREAGLNYRLFTTEQGANPMQQDLDVYRMVPLENDPPLHTRIRAVLTPFFVPAALDALDDQIRAIVVELIEQCVAQSPVDLVKKFSIVLPSRVFFELFLGEDPKEIQWIVELTQRLIDDPSTAPEGAPKLLKWCAETLQGRRLAGISDDLIGVIAHAGNEPDFTLTERQRVEILNLLILAGMETTANGISSVIHTFATNPAAREKLADADADRINRVIDEFLRYASPVTSAARTLTDQSDGFGCPMHKGERVILSWTAANHDPAVFKNPEQLDLERNASQHLAFGVGHHKCLGMHLAKREMRLAIEELRKLAVFELVDGTEITYRTGPQQGIVSLPVHFDF